MILKEGSRSRQDIIVTEIFTEMYHFSEKYGYSNGKMYIALVDEKLAGCVALTKK